MAENVDDLTVSYTEGDLETVKELDKKILTKGAWATVIFKYQSWDSGKNSYTSDKYTIRRYQKRNGIYQAKSKFNISSNDQAQKIIDALGDWLSEESDTPE
ncbi:MAG: hypothetical protein CL816_01280 [Coxiellaceae bacterium]|nr:hypothetical protein [Coxiellaceae bacterium]|tara:strand:- start:668 stop:970 length:303 start_codon:yes stop_codon:yes gene_type:complete